MAHYVKCCYCSQTFDRDKVKDCVPVGRRYAHKDCYEKKQSEKTQEEKDLEALEGCIKKLFSTDFINPRIRKQIKDYVEQYKYTYTGITKTLMYFFEVKKNPIEKANGGIGIVPYVYKDAHNYYFNIWMANQQNESKAKAIEQYQPQERVIVIPPPQRVEKKKKRFSFLDEEE